MSFLDGVDRFLRDEFQNQYVMVRDAARKDEVVPAVTWGSALDSLNQMPDEIVEDITEVASEKFRSEFKDLVNEYGADTEIIL